MLQLLNTAIPTAGKLGHYRKSVFEKRGPFRVIADGNELQRCWYVDTDLGIVRQFVTDEEGNYIPNSARDGLVWDALTFSRVELIDKDGAQA